MGSRKFETTNMFRKKLATPKPVSEANTDNLVPETDEIAPIGDQATPSESNEAAQAAPVKRVRAVRAVKPDSEGKPTRARRSVTKEPLAVGVAGDLPVPIWRTAQRLIPRSEQQAAAVQTEAPPKPASRRTRQTRAKQEAPDAVVEPSITKSEASVDIKQPLFRKTRSRKAPVESQAPVKPKREALPAKALLEIPVDAPQIVLRDGIPTLVRQQRVYPPIAFFGSCADEKSAAIVLDEIRLAADADIHLHSLLIDLQVDPSAVDAAAGLAAYLLARVVAVDPDAQLIFRVVFVAPKNWATLYPASRFRGGEGEPSVCDDIYWSVARNCLDTFVRKLRLLDQRDHILGIHLDRGEWFLPQDAGYDDSDAALTKFRDWVRTRYSEDEVALRASWFDGSASFDSLRIPAYEPKGSEGDRFVRSSRKQRRYVDYHFFLSDANAYRIGELAYTAKVASDGYFLVGASYGYTFEWAHPSNGHLALGKLLRTPEIDFIAGPPSYKSRESGGSAAFPCPIDSFALNGKLYLSEEDYKTAIGTGREPDDFNPVIKTPQSLENVHWRGAGAALAHASGMSWMDLWGNGWLKTATIWDRAAKVRDALISRMATPLGDPDVAVFIDERALAYLVDPNAFQLLVQNAREAVLRSGLSAGFYLLSDLAHREKFPEAKLYIFLNAWDIRPDLRSAIKERLHRDGKVLFWLYSAGLFDAGRDSLERARDVTGIALKPQPYHSKSGTSILNRRHPLADAFPNRSIPPSGLEPSYFGINEDATVLGEYSQTGLPSFLVKESSDPTDASSSWTSVFLGEPVISPALVRTLGQMASAHVWNFQDDVMHIRPPFVTVHCSGAGPRAITLPNGTEAYDLLAGHWVSGETNHIRFAGQDGSTHIFLAGPRLEIEHLLATDSTGLLHMEELPERAENTVRFDAVGFDIPIMRLNEWIEGGVSDEVAEDWLLRAPVLDEAVSPPPDEEPDLSSGRRRRRRRRPSDRGGSEETSSPRREQTDVQAFGDLEINVRFRKRE